MITLEQIKLLESKVTKLIDHVKKVTEENTSLKGKLDSYQKRINELEVMFLRFKEDQGLIADGFRSVLDRLNQVEDAAELKVPAETKVSAELKVPAEPNISAENGNKIPEKTKTPQDTKAARKKDEVPETKLPDLKPEVSKDNEKSTEVTGAELDIF